jgi:hypothetical protein
MDKTLRAEGTSARHFRSGATGPVHLEIIGKITELPVPTVVTSGRGYRNRITKAPDIGDANGAGWGRPKDRADKIEIIG